MTLIPTKKTDINYSEHLVASDYLQYIYTHHISTDSQSTTISTQQIIVNLNAQIASLSDTPLDILNSMPDIKSHLRKTKAHFSFYWSLAFIYKLLPFDALGQKQTLFAETSIHTALRSALHLNKIITDKSSNADYLSGLFILGLGKLGGVDLNFSSDVDLIAFFDKQKLPSAIASSSVHTVSKCLKTMSSLLSEKINGEFVWRVDWRLRPNASSMYLSHSTEFAEDFYFFHAQPWHRLALVKARPIAGDMASGEKFLNDIHNFIWRKNLDFRDIDEISRLKRKINLEHPNLKLQRRQKKEDNLNTIAGFNVKLGHGGIREIEFIVNALQLLWGGKKHTLQDSNTLKNLNNLQTEGLFAEKIIDDLSRAYITLRTTENAIQMLGNQQTYHIPHDLIIQKKLMQILSLTWEDFCKDITATRKTVAAQFSMFFSAVEDSELDKLSEIYTKITSNENINDENIGIINSWFNGFKIYSISQTQTTQLKPLAPLMVKQLEASDVDINLGIQRLHKYLKSLPVGGQYLRLLLAKPALLEKLVKPLLLSESMQILLEQSPHIIEQFFESSNSFYTEKKINIDTQFVKHAVNYEERLERLRRITNENLYAIYLCYLRQEIDFLYLEKSLSQLAEKLLTFTFELVKEEMNIAHAPIAIIGLGKLAIDAMGPRSDIDIIFIFDNKKNQALANRFVSRFISAINLRMREGIVYELDNRLRPYGNSGSVCISLDSFKNYQNQRAKTWEHLALTSSEFITGDKHVGEKVHAIKAQVLTRPREANSFYMDCYDMLRMIREQRIKYGADVFAAKLISGGQMELEYIINAITLMASKDNPEWVNLEYPQRISKLNALTIFNDIDLQALLYFFRQLQISVRFYGYEYVALDGLPSWIKTRLCEDFKVKSIHELSALTLNHCKQVLNIIDTFFEDLNKDNIKDWSLKPATWMTPN